jgi:hypothetical protein
VIRLELLPRSRRTSRNGRSAFLVLGSLAVLLDAGATYSSWRAATYAGGRAAVERAGPALDASSSDFRSYPFRLGAILPLDRGVGCARDEARTDSASQSGDGSFDINCIAGATVKAVGDLPRAELLSWPGVSRYDRAVRF